MKHLLISIFLFSCTTNYTPIVEEELPPEGKVIVTYDYNSPCCKTSFEHNFEKGDCVKFNPDLVEPWQSTEGLPMLIELVGKRSYKVSFKHPNFDERTVFFAKFKAFDEEFIKIETKNGCK